MWGQGNPNVLHCKQSSCCTCGFITVAYFAKFKPGSPGIQRINQCLGKGVGSYSVGQSQLLALQVRKKSALNFWYVSMKYLETATARHRTEWTTSPNQPASSRHNCLKSQWSFLSIPPLLGSWQNISALESFISEFLFEDINKSAGLHSEPQFCSPNNFTLFHQSETDCGFSSFVIRVGIDICEEEQKA